MNNKLVELKKQMNEILRNIILFRGDLSGDTLTEQFFNREDILTSPKIEQLKSINNKIKNLV